MAPISLLMSTAPAELSVGVFDAGALVVAGVVLVWLVSWLVGVVFFPCRPEIFPSIVSILSPMPARPVVKAVTAAVRLVSCNVRASVRFEACCGGCIVG